MDITWLWTIVVLFLANNSVLKIVSAADNATAPANGTAAAAATNSSGPSDPRASIKGGWIRLCQGGSVLGMVAADKCASGYWFKDPIKIGCACGHGIWVFAKGWCDKSAKLIVAQRGSCFSVDKDVRYMRFLGYAKNAYLPYHFQSSVGFEYIQELPIDFEEYSYSNANYDMHLGAIFPNKQIESPNSRRCLEYNATAPKNAVVMKYYADKLPYRQTEYCYKPHGIPNLYTFDESIQLNEYFTPKEKSKGPPKTLGPLPGGKANDGSCAAQCKTEGKNAGTEKPSATTFPPDYFDPLIDDYIVVDKTNGTQQNATAAGDNSVGGGGNSTSSSGNSTAPSGNSTMKPQKPRVKLSFPNFYKKSVQDCDERSPTYNLTNKTVREIKEQTKRMVMTMVTSSLKGTPSPKVDVPDYVLFQVARQIMLNVCPNEEVPHMLVTNLLKMFRVVLKESLRWYPFEDKTDENRTQTILTGLKTCLETAKPFYWNYENSTSPNATCPLEWVDISYSYKGGSVNRTLYADIPQSLRTDLQQLDLPVETAWKTVMFAHYYCARHFQFNTTEYSHFYDKMEMFFNRWIQHRWYAPGPSYKAYEYVFQMYDLNKFSENLDRCVGASRSFSNFRHWLKRPVYIKHCGGTTFQSLDDGKKSKAATPKLDAITPELTEFDKKAFCLPYWHSPASNPGINYDAAKDSGAEGCVKWKPSEWMDNVTPNTRSTWFNELF